LSSRFPKTTLRYRLKFRLQSSLPVFADESCQRLSHLPAIAEAFDGVNIKLMKCGGLSEALQMIHSARAKGMQVLIGCMSESSIGCDAAAHLAPLCDYADLDGPFLITNDFNRSAMGIKKPPLSGGFLVLIPVSRSSYCTSVAGSRMLSCTPLKLLTMPVNVLLPDGKAVAEKVAALLVK
jgi:hypothetical protein